MTVSTEWPPDGPFPTPREGSVVPGAEPDQHPEEHPSRRPRSGGDVEVAEAVAQHPTSRSASRFVPLSLADFLA